MSAMRSRSNCLAVGYTTAEEVSLSTLWFGPDCLANCVGLALAGRRTLLKSAAEAELKCLVFAITSSTYGLGL